MVDLESLDFPNPNFPNTLVNLFPFLTGLSVSPVDELGLDAGTFASEPSRSRCDALSCNDSLLEEC